MFDWGAIRIDVIVLFSSLLYSMGIRCDRREEMASMEGMDIMIYYIITAICIVGLLAGLFYSLYMAIWGVYDEFY